MLRWIAKVGREAGPYMPLNPPGCLGYVITGRIGNCIMLPMWRRIGKAITNFMIRNAILFRGSIIDKNNNPEIGNLFEVKLPFVQGRSKFLCVLCGTKRKFVVGVPQNITTALEAQAWITGLHPQDFQLPEVRT